MLTFHNDNMRTGWNSKESTLTPALVSGLNFGVVSTIQFDGLVVAQPLYVSSFTLPGSGGTHNLLIVATEHNSVYALDADTGTTLWQKNLGVSQSTTDVGCPDIQPEYGITGTPVITRSANTGKIYVVAATEPAAMAFHTQLHALDLATGSETAAPVEINPSATMSNGAALSFDAKDQMNRTSLIFANNGVYVGLGSHCDNNPGVQSGWLLRFDPSTLAQTSAWNTVDDSAPYQMASIWMTGYAGAVDAGGNIYVATGNGAFDANVAGGKNYGESVVKLNASLSPVDYFMPSSLSADSTADQDFGSGGVMLVPGSAKLLAMGKTPNLYMLNTASLGGLQTNDAGALQVYQDSGNPGGVWGGPALFQPDAATTYVYYQLDHTGLQQFALSGSSLALKNTGPNQAGFGGSSPVVSSNGTVGGIVWAVLRNTVLYLEAYDATDVTTLLFSASAGFWNNTQNNAFVTPLVANGKVYVPGAAASSGAGGAINVFGVLHTAGTQLAAAKPFRARYINASILPVTRRAMPVLSHIEGVIVARGGSTLTLRRRNGTQITVDISIALAKHTTGAMPMNRAVIVYGSRGTDGVFHVQMIGHASSRATDSGPDTGL